jgi:hypothetical protein
MFNKSGLFLLVSFYSLTVWSAPDLTIINTSDKSGAVFVGNRSCEDTFSCVIYPKSSVRINDEVLKDVCAETPENCSLVFSVSGINAAIASGQFSLTEGVRYIARSRWIEYTARDLTDTVVEIYKK